MTTVPNPGVCVHCTMPTEHGSVCDFCRLYVPPEMASGESVDGYISDAAKHARYAFEDLGDAAEVAGEPVLPEARELLLAALRLLDEAAE